MPSLFLTLLTGLCLLGMGVSVQAVPTNATPLGPAATTKVLIRMTVLGISEGVLYGSTIDDHGMSIGFVSDTLGTNDILYTVVKPNSVHPSFFATNGDFTSATNIPKFPAGHSYFTEITGYSQGIVVGNYSIAPGGSKAFLISTNGTFSTFTYPGAKVGTTVVTGIDRGTVVGHFRDAANGFHGFSITITNGHRARLDVPSVFGRTYVEGISEGVIYGCYVWPKGVYNGFIYSQGNYTKINVPGAANFTEITGYSQGSVAGDYLDTNRVRHGFYYDGTNYTTADVGTMGYSRIESLNQEMSAGNYLETNGVMYDSTSTNVVNPRDILLTTNYWQTTLAAYPPRPTTKQPTRYIAPASNGGNSGVTGVTGLNLVNGATLLINGIGTPVIDVIGL